METENNIEIIKHKIRKLLALTKSPNENEASAALKKASDLMELYRLDKNTCEGEEIVCIKSYALKKATWIDEIAGAIAWLYAIYVVKDISRYRNAAERAHFYGSRLDVFIATEMYKYLVNTINRMGKQNIKKNAKTKYRESYKSGLANNVIHRIFIMGENMSWAPERKHKSEILKKRVNTVFLSKTTFLDLKSSKDKINNAAKLRGYNDGSCIHINRQATGSGGRMIAQTGGDL
jgi:hypothetical protein